MKITLKELNDGAITHLKSIKKNKGACDCEEYDCESCELRLLDCGNFDEVKIKINKKKRKAVLTEK